MDKRKEIEFIICNMQFVRALMRSLPVQLNEIDVEILFDKIAAFERRGLKNSESVTHTHHSQQHLAYSHSGHVTHLTPNFHVTIKHTLSLPSSPSFEEFFSTF